MAKALPYSKLLLYNHMKPYIILILLVIIAFSNSLQNEFVWDDHLLIEENPKINLSIREVPSVFATPLWEMAGLEGKQTYYRPVVYLFLALNYKIWGAKPFGFHLSNLLLHLIIAMVLYRIGLLLFNNDKLISLIGASIFAVHPVHNEPVGRAAGGEVIFGFFIILSIYFFLKEKNYLSWLTFFLALLSKEISVMLPFALVILTVNKQGVKKGMIEIIPYIILVGIYLIIRTMVVDVVLGINIQQPLLTQTLTMMTATFDYIRLLILPYNLSPFYPARWYTSVFDVKVLIAATTLIIVCVTAFKVRKDRVMLYLLLFTFIMFIPVIWRVNTFPIGNESVYIAERFLYAPLMAFSLFISASAIRLLGDRKKSYIIIGWMLTLVVFIIASMSANKIWKNDFTISKRIIEKFSEHGFGYYSMGTAYLKQGRFDEAIKEYQTAIQLKPNYPDAYNSLGLAYFKKGRIGEAIEAYQTALGIEPFYAQTYMSLGFVYYDQNLLSEAINMYQAALKINPNYPEAHNNLGLAYYKQGKIEEAVNEYLIALKLNPLSVGAHNNLGTVYFMQSRFDEAIKEYQTALKIGTNNTLVHYNLGLIYKSKGLKDEARKEFEIALRLKPELTEAQKALQSLK